MFLGFGVDLCIVFLYKNCVVVVCFVLSFRACLSMLLGFLMVFAKILGAVSRTSDDIASMFRGFVADSSSICKNCVDVVWICLGFRRYRAKSVIARVSQISGSVSENFFALYFS